MFPKKCHRWQRTLPSNIVFRHHGGALIRALTRQGFQDLIPGEEIPLLQCNTPLDLLDFLREATPCLLNQWEPEEKHLHHFHCEEGALVFLANHPHSVSPEHQVERFFFERPPPKFADLKKVAEYLEVPRLLGVWATLPRALGGLLPLTRSQTIYKFPKIVPSPSSISVSTSWEEAPKAPEDTLPLTKATVTTPYLVSDQDLSNSKLYEKYLAKYSLARKLFPTEQEPPEEGETFCSATGNGTKACTEFDSRPAVTTGVTQEIISPTLLTDSLRVARCKAYVLNISDEENTQLLRLLDAAPDLLGSSHLKGVSNIQDLIAAWGELQKHALVPETLMLNPVEYYRLNTLPEISCEGTVSRLWGVALEPHTCIPPGKGFLVAQLAGEFTEITPLTETGRALEETYHMSLWDGRRLVVLDFEDFLCSESE